MNREFIGVEIRACIVACLSTFMCGNYIAWPSVAMHAGSYYIHIVLASNVVGYGLCEEVGLSNVSSLAGWGKHRHHHMTIGWAVWIVGVLYLGALLSPFAASYAANSIGRKNALLGCIIPFFGSWLLVFMTKRTFIFLISRFTAGIGMGIAYTACPIYICEISRPKYRRCMLNIMQIMFTLGVAYALLIGHYVNVTLFHLLQFLIPGIFFLAVCFIPESPYFHLMNNEKYLAEWELLRLRGSRNLQAVKKEFVEIKYKIDQNNIKNQGKRTGIKDIFRFLFHDKYNFNSLFITTGLSIVQQLTGMYAIISITSYFFSKIKTESLIYKLNASKYSFIVATCALLVSLIPLTFVNKIGNRFLLFFSITGTSLSVLALTFAELFFTFTPPSIHWIILVVILALHFGMFNVALGYVPYIVTNDMFPIDSKVQAFAVNATITFLTAFIISQTYAIIIFKYVHFYVHSILFVLSILGIPFVYFFVPETINKDLNDIRKIVLCARHKFWIYSRVRGVRPSETSNITEIDFNQTTESATNARDNSNTFGSSTKEKSATEPPSDPKNSQNEEKLQNLIAGRNIEENEDEASDAEDILYGTSEPYPSHSDIAETSTNESINQIKSTKEPEKDYGRALEESNNKGLSESQIPIEYDEEQFEQFIKEQESTSFILKYNEDKTLDKSSDSDSSLE